jgi:triosephosphate isomerase
MRTPLLAGNWKMHMTSSEARDLAAGIRARVAPAELGAGLEVVLAPAFTSLFAVAAAVEGSAVQVAAQDMHWADAGAFTGAISPRMILEFAGRVILGHSERRQHFGETDADVHRKVHAALHRGLAPIVCVGETAAERDAERTDAVVAAQVGAAVEGLSGPEVASLVFAYEPVWAIGTGRACDPEEADRVAQLVREVLRTDHPGAAADARVLYGGSVTAANVMRYVGYPDIDGALVGGASLDADGFAAMIRAVAAAVTPTMTGSA